MKEVYTFTKKNILIYFLVISIFSLHPNILLADTNVLHADVPVASKSMPTVVDNYSLPYNSIKSYKDIGSLNALVSTTTTVIPFNSSWRYHDDGSNQGDTWRSSSFNDGKWKTGFGKLGYGLSGINTTVNLGPVKKGVKGNPITTYFRKTIQIPNAANFSSFSAIVNRNDGIVVYVNGTEVYRNNLPSKTIYYKTLASTKIVGDGPVNFEIGAAAFRDGDNVIAVEVHQASSSSTDLSFDMQLIGNVKEILPPSDTTPPGITSIDRFNPTNEITTARQVTFRATFTESVTGVDQTDFILTMANGMGAALASVTQVGSEASVYDITVNSISGLGQLRLDMKDSGTGITDAAGNAIVGGYSAGQSYTIENPALTGFASITNLNPIEVSANTGEKPQSKVWNHDGKFWMVMPNSTGTYIWRLDGNSWTSTLQLSNATVAFADCKPIGNVVHILLYSGISSNLASVEYNTTLGAYQPWSANPTNVPVALDAGVETATIDIDGTGRMWLASDAKNEINVRWSNAPYTTWSAPIVLASNVTTDDICAVVAMPGKIGVFWSNQATQRFGFKYHNDDSAPETWSADEVPASNSALDIGGGMADDHLNMAVAQDGTLYCAIKTSYNTSGYDRIGLLVRRPNGIWDNMYKVAGGGTRPIVVLNDKLGIVRVAYTSADNGGNILYKESYTNSISFGPILTLLSGSIYNNVSSSKDNFTSEIVFLAGNGTQAFSVLASESASSIQTSQQTSSITGSINYKREAKDNPMNTIEAYPNPFSKELFVRVASEATGKVMIQLQSIDGHTIYSNSVMLNKGLHEINVPLNKLNQGLYLLRVTGNGINQTHKVIKSY